jgi:hypothetical protein
MLSLLKKLLRGLGKAAVAVVAAILILFIVLFAGGALVSLLLGHYGMAAAFSYALVVFLATLVLFIRAVQGKETALDAVDVAGLVPGVCVGTAAGLAIAVAATIIGDGLSIPLAIKLMVVSSVLGAALLS